MHRRSFRKSQAFAIFTIPRGCNSEKGQDRQPITGDGRKFNHVRQSGPADENGTQRFIIGLNRADIESLLEGNVVTLPRGVLPVITEDSDVVLLFAETDHDIGRRFPPVLRPVEDINLSIETRAGSAGAGRMANARSEGRWCHWWTRA